jgi:hypothetical protein
MDLVHIVKVSGLHMRQLQFNPRITLEFQQVIAIIIFETTTRATIVFNDWFLLRYRTLAGQKVVPGTEVLVLDDANSTSSVSLMLLLDEDMMTMMEL